MFLYLVPCGGMSGDMFLGALFGLGVDAEQVFAPLQKAGLRFSWNIRPTARGAIQALKVDISAEDHEHAHRGLDDILTLIGKTDLPSSVAENVTDAFRLLASVEAEIHGSSVDEVHFHEVGALDSIVDITAGLYGVYLLGVKGVYTEPAPLGSGWVETQHGRLPLPAPATVKLLEDVPCRKSNRTGEQVTPTGALLLNSLGAGPLPDKSFVFHKTAYGAGSRNDADHPNVLRAHLIEMAASSVAESEMMQVVFDVDDMTGEEVGFLRERLEEAGIREIAVMPAYFKKGRPGLVIQALVPTGKLDEFTSVAFSVSSTFGLRWWPVARRVLDRRIEELPTPYGTVRTKTGDLGNGRRKRTIEYEDTAQIARKFGVSLSEARDIIEDAVAKRTAEEKNESPETEEAP